MGTKWQFWTGKNRLQGRLPFSWIWAAVLHFWFEGGYLVAQPDSLLFHKINLISATRQGQILAADAQSNIYLLDTTGKLLYQFSPKRPAKIHLLDGWNGLRPFAFYRDFQEYVLLDRFLLADNFTRLDPEKTGYARLLAPSQDGNLWVLDESNFQLKKIDISNQKTLFSTPLDLVLTAKQYDLCFMREYQNQLYICDRKGPLLQFDQMGNFRKKLPVKNANWVGFNGDTLYATEGDTVRFYHPYHLHTTKRALPAGIKPGGQLLYMGTSIWWVDEKGLNHRKR